MNANAIDPDGVIAKVEFLLNGELAGEDAAAPYSFGWTNAPPGVHRVQAVAEDDCGARTTSDDLVIYVYEGQDAVECAKAHLAGLLGGLLTAFSLISIESVEWPDACLGCLRRAGCAQVVTLGKRILLAGLGDVHEVQASNSGKLVLCGADPTTLSELSPGHRAAAIGLEPVDEVQWELLDRGELHLVRLETTAPKSVEQAPKRSPKAS